MLISTPNQSQLISRIFTDQNGRSFRLTFLVTVVNGEVRGRLVSAQPLSSSLARLPGAVCDGTFCLPITLSAKTPNTVYAPSFAPAVSPYFSLEFLINSQPTRAPAFAR
jgi:hypothetical protein